MLNPAVHYVGDEVIVQQRCVIEKFDLEIVKEKLRTFNGGKNVKDVYVHYEGQTCHHNLKKLGNDDDVTIFLQEVYDKKIHIVHVYGTIGKDHEIMDYIQGGDKCFNQSIGERVRMRKGSRESSTISLEYTMTRNEIQGLGGGGDALKSPVARSIMGQIEASVEKNVRLGGDNVQTRSHKRSIALVVEDLDDEVSENEEENEDDESNDSDFEEEECDDESDEHDQEIQGTKKRKKKYKSQPQSEEDGDKEFRVEREATETEFVQKTILQPYDQCEHQNNFVIGMTFKDAVEFRDEVRKYAINNRKKLRITKSCKTKVRFNCQSGCPWVIYAAKEADYEGLIVKTHINKHNCGPCWKKNMISAKYVADLFREKIMENPTFKVKDIQTDVKVQLQQKVTWTLCKKAKMLVMDELKSRFSKEFNILEAYCEELLESDPGSYVRLEVCRPNEMGGKRVFKRLFICLKAIKNNWKGNCRPIIGLDGCFMKNKREGQFLSVVGLDAMNQFFPIAWALVDRETKLNWIWFLECLQDYLELEDGSNMTLMSDMQKGLVKSVESVLPEAKHRLCARHIWANWNKHFPGRKMTEQFWIVSWSSYEEQFIDNMENLGKLNKRAQDALLEYDPRTWVRAYFSGRCKSNKCENNFTESFNAWILELRFMPVVSLLEGVRHKVMERIEKNSHLAEKWIDAYSPNAMLDLFINKCATAKCRVVYNGDDGFEVNEGEDRHIVNLHSWKCTCRWWELSGIPCQHACSAIYKMREDPISYMVFWYNKQFYEQTYKNKVQPLRGKQFWNLDDFEELEGLPPQKELGRPRYKRKNTKYEIALEKSKKRVSNKDPSECMPRIGQHKKCSICKEANHNSKTCTKQPIYKEPVPSQQASNIGTSSIDNNKDPPIVMVELSQLFKNLAVCTQSSQIQQDESAQREKLIPRKAAAVCTISLQNQQETSTLIGDISYKTTNKGCGLLYKPDGSLEFHSGTSSEFENMEHDPDPIGKNLPILDEVAHRFSQGSERSDPVGTRRIQMRSVGGEAPPPSNLPFEGRTLKWRGEKAITTSKLQKVRDDKASTKLNLRKRSKESVSEASQQQSYIEDLTVTTIGEGKN